MERISVSQYSSLLDHPFGTKQKKNSTTSCRGREKCTLKVNGRFLRTQIIGSIWEKHKKTDCSFGRQGHTPFSFTIQCQLIASKKWYSFKETIFFNQRVSTPRSAEVSQRCLAVNAAAASKAHYQAAGDRLRRKIQLRLISEFKEFHKMQCSKIKEE